MTAQDARSLDEAPFLDLFSDEYRDDRFGVLERARLDGGVVRTAAGPMVIRHDLVYSLLRSPQLHSAFVQMVEFQGVTDGPIVDNFRNFLLNLNGEAHSRLRTLVNRSFTPRAVESYRPAMRAILTSLLDPLVERGRCEFLADVANRYPLRVITQLLGVPLEDLDDFDAWVKALSWALSLDLGEHRQDAEWGIIQLEGYLRRLVQQRREDPRDDLVTALVDAEAVGDRMSEPELVVMLNGLLVGGYETTRNQLAIAMTLFVQHPDQWDLLAERPDLAPRAVDEVLRMHGTSWTTYRIPAEDLVVDGYNVPAGTFMLLATAAANHDPAVFDQPATFDITAEREQPLTFGGGPHHCLGANLARAELEEALTLLPARMSELAFEGDVTWRPPLGLLGPDALPLRFQPRADAASGPAAVL